MDECVFCKIARGEMATQVIYEDADVFAFDDLSPQAPVHALVIPRQHYESLADDVPPEMLGAVFSAVREVARIKGISQSGFRVIVNSGHDANQTVPHLHVHVMGGKLMSHGMVNFREGS